jgi:hypothetical protein
MSNVRWWNWEGEYTQDNKCPKKWVYRLLPYERFDDCGVYFTNSAPYYGTDFLKVDYEACTDTYCPIVLNRTNVEEFWMNNDPNKFVEFRFTIKNYIET